MAVQEAMYRAKIATLEEEAMLGGEFLGFANVKDRKDRNLCIMNP